MNTLEQIVFIENYAQLKIAVEDLEYMKKEEKINDLETNIAKLNELFIMTINENQIKIVQELLRLKERWLEVTRNIFKLQERFKNKEYHQELLKLVHSMKTSVTTADMLLRAMEFETMLNVLNSEENMMYVDRAYSLLGDIQDSLLIWCEQ